MVPAAPGKPVMVKAAMPLADAAAAARRVGQVIATSRPKALNGRSIQDLETWDDHDEEVAGAIAAAIEGKHGIVGQGDDAQLLAGATLAVLHNGDLYDEAQAALNAALDDSYRKDPIWGALIPDHAFAPDIMQRHQTKPKSKPATKIAAAGVKRPAGRTSRSKR
jgi:hypothetical protein